MMNNFVNKKKFNLDHVVSILIGDQFKNVLMKLIQNWTLLLFIAMLEHALNNSTSIRTGSKSLIYGMK
jgi:hypothetical protein